MTMMPLFKRRCLRLYRRKYPVVPRNGKLITNPEQAFLLKNLYVRFAENIIEEERYAEVTHGSAELT